MSSRPVLAALEARIADLPDGEDSVFDRIADGDKVRDIMADLGVSRPMFWTWLNHAPYAERRKPKYEAAKRASAESVFEDGGELLDNLANLKGAELTPALVTLTAKRADWRARMAAVRDPDKFGDKQGPAVVVNLASLHLDALRQIGSMTVTNMPALMPAEVVEDGEEAEV